MIHPSAIVSTESQIGENVTIGVGAIIEEGVVIGAGCVIEPYSILKRGTILSDDVKIHSHAVVGGLPQDLSFDEVTVSGVRVGQRTVIREGVTLNRASKEGGYTEIGSDCFLMAFSHVAHDCCLGDHVVLANNVMLAGFASVDDYAFIGGGVAVHQFSRIGESVMISGNTALSKDAPPYVMIAERDDLIGLNLVGLKRRKFSRDEILDIKECYRYVYGEMGNYRKLAASAMAEGVGKKPQGQKFLRFFETGERGFVKPRYKSSKVER